MNQQDCSLRLTPTQRDTHRKESLTNKRRTPHNRRHEYRVRESAPPETQGLFRHGAAQSEFGASIFWVNAGTSFADMEDLIVGWQTRRDLQRRGIVEVMEHD